MEVRQFCQSNKGQFDEALKTKGNKMTAKTAKTVNYTAEQTAAVVTGYLAGSSVETLAAEVGKSVRSIVAKLSKEGVYVAKKAAAKVDGRVTKADLVAEMAQIMGVEAEVLASLEKASTEALTLVTNALRA